MTVDGARQISIQDILRRMLAN